MLGYVPDQRHHPAITYLRYGIPVVLGADDPATFGYNEFTLDWYEAFMAWGLNLGDLRHLAMNSLQYSSLSASEKKTNGEVENCMGYFYYGNEIQSLHAHISKFNTVSA